MCRLICWFIFSLKMLQQIVPTAIYNNCEFPHENVVFDFIALISTLIYLFCLKIRLIYLISNFLSRSPDHMIKSPSSTSMLRNGSSNELQGLDIHRVNSHFMRKIPLGSEASNILVGEVDFLDKTLSAFIRLSQASILGDLTEVPVPTR